MNVKREKSFLVISDMLLPVEKWLVQPVAI